MKGSWIGATVIALMFAITPHVSWAASVVGTVDSVNDGYVQGWAFDPDSSGTSIQLALYVDAPAGSTQPTSYTIANIPRPDVNAAYGITGAHGFSIPLPSSVMDGGSHTAYVYGIDTDSSSINAQLYNSPKSFTGVSHNPTGALDGINPDGVAGGWAGDPDVLSQPIDVHFYIDQPAASNAGNYVGAATANISRPDVNAATPYAGNHGFAFQIPAEYRDGKTHTLYAYAINAGSLGSNMQLPNSPRTFTLAAPPTPPPPAADGNATISANGISISTTARTSGAVASITWNGKQFVDNVDHGRQFQIAWTGGAHGQCFNPTEAGSAADGTGQTTSSQLVSISGNGNQLTTVNHPAFWIAPGVYDSGCDFMDAPGVPLWRGNYAVNQAITSRSSMGKQIEIGAQGIPNVVKFGMDITLDAQELNALPLPYLIVEAPAVYMPYEFMHAYKFDPASGALNAVQGGFSATPTIMTTADQQYALGVYSPDVQKGMVASNDQHNYLGYGVYDWGVTAGAGTRLAILPQNGASVMQPGTIHLTTYFILGTMKDVQTAMQKLHATLNPNTPPPPSPTNTSHNPIGFLDSVSPTGLMSGWAGDPDDISKPVSVHLYVDYPASMGSKGYVKEMTTIVPRPDVNTNTQFTKGNHGFAMQLPSLFADGKPHTAYVYALNAAGEGSTVELINSGKQFTLTSIQPQSVSGDGQISSNGIAIKTTTRDAGGIASLTWNGKQFVDDYDHGRQIQVAFAGPQGECFNPTEVGSDADGTSNMSSSRLVSYSAQGNVLQTTSHPAFWKAPGTWDGTCNFSPTRTEGIWINSKAVNKTTVSKSTLTKKVTIGALGVANAIEFQTDIALDAQETQHLNLPYLIVENPALAIPGEFSRGYWFDPTTGALTDKGTIANGVGIFNTLPSIVSTQDKQYAIGVYTRDIPKTGFPNNEQHDFVGYSLNGIEGVVSPKPRFPLSPQNGSSMAGDVFHLKTYLLVGTLNDVTSGMQRLYAALNPNTAPVSHDPTGHVDSVSSSGVVSGWAGDPDAVSVPLLVHFYIDQTANAQGTGLVGQSTANMPRPDVNSATTYTGPHGFSFQIPSTYADGKTHKLYVYPINSAGTPGNNVDISGGGIQFTVQPPSVRTVAFPSVWSWARELPPTIAQSGSTNTYILGGVETWACTSNGNFFNASDAQCQQILTPTIDSSTRQANLTQAQADTQPAFKRNYYGVFSAVPYTDQNGQSRILAIAHNENKGEPNFLNSVSRNLTNLANGVTGTTCVSELDGCYFSFVSASTAPTPGNTGYTELGPIIWPSAGYISADGTKALDIGPRHPHAFIKDGYAYVFYTDWERSNADRSLAYLHTGDRRAGLKVARAKLPNVGPGNWFTYYNGDFSQPSLPSGFRLDDPSFLSTPGPKATPLFPNKTNPNQGSYETGSFAVAQLTDIPNAYVGVEQYAEWGDENTGTCYGKFGLALRYSEDLIHWSDRMPLQTCVDGNAVDVNYPEFVNANGTSNTKIDSRDFYIAGTKYNGNGIFELHTLHVSLSANQIVIPHTSSSGANQQSTGGASVSNTGNQSNTTQSSGQQSASSSTSGTQTQNGAQCTLISNNLIRGMSGKDVRDLQAFLIARGYLRIPKPTGYFGYQTERAVQRFQYDQGIITAGTPYSTGFGFVGLVTRLRIQTMCTAALQ